MKYYDDKKPGKYITHSNANDLYSLAVSQYLPYNGYKWLNKKEIDKFCLNWIERNYIEEKSSIRYILKVDLEYPDELHEWHNDYPLALQKLKINHNRLWYYYSNIANEYGIKCGGVNKIFPKLGNKSKYVPHYRNAQLHLSLGMELDKIHKILKYKQTIWLVKEIIWF